MHNGIAGMAEKIHLAAAIALMKMNAESFSMKISHVQLHRALLIHSFISIMAHFLSAAGFLEPVHTMCFLPQPLELCL